MLAFKTRHFIRHMKNGFDVFVFHSELFYLLVPKVEKSSNCFYTLPFKIKVFYGGISVQMCVLPSEKLRVTALICSFQHRCQPLSLVQLQFTYMYF